MLLLLAGLILFFAVHSVPMLPGVKNRLLKSLGESRYKGIFSLLALAGLITIIGGMRQAGFQPIWTPPTWSAALANLLMPVAFVLLTAANLPNNIRRIVRNPMLTGILLWSSAHLIANGDLASMLLFGSFAAFSIIDIVSANRRTATAKPERQAFSADALVILIGVATFWLLRYFHSQLFGVAVQF